MLPLALYQLLTIDIQTTMRFFLLFQLAIVAVFHLSCSKDKDALDKLATTLNQRELTLRPGDTAFVAITIKDTALLNNHTWTLKNNRILEIVEEGAGQIKFVAEAEGKAVLYIYYPTRERTDSCVVYVGKPNLIRVLAIGNSFSEDALEGELYNLFKARNRQVVIGNLYIGGASFSTHLNNAVNNLSAYSYRKININGEKTTTERVTLQQAIQDESWDYISMQQVSQESGILETFVPNLSMLYEYVNGVNSYRTTRYLLHQTWAYSPLSNHFGFVNYNRDQVTMYNAICNTYRAAVKLAPISRVIPSGTAIQNARNTILGDDLTRDGFHLNADVGRFIAACTWFEGLTRTNVKVNPYVPANMSDTVATISKNSAHAAIVRPFEVSVAK